MSAWLPCPAAIPPTAQRQGDPPRRHELRIEASDRVSPVVLRCSVTSAHQSLSWPSPNTARAAANAAPGAVTST
jgi:hypothetical protein